VPRPAPPTKFNGAAHVVTLSAGTVLSRVHRSAYGGLDFNPVASDVVFGGGRFDSTNADPYGFLYAGVSDATAIAEALLRDLDANDYGARFLAKKYWRGRQLSRLKTTTDLELVALRTGTDLGAVGVGTWLTDCDPDEYPESRAWGHWIRSIAPGAAGFLWLSKREPGTDAYVFFDDRCTSMTFTAAPGPLPGACDFDDVTGRQWLRDHLAPYRVTIRIH
jgi:RES domain